MKKKAEDLKPGDIINFGMDRAIVTDHPRAAPSSNLTDISYLLEGRLSVLTQRLTANAEYEVESPTLTPAQQHAEELLEAARYLLNVRLRGLQPAAEGTVAVQRLIEIVARIDPPKPPSVEEAIELLLRARNRVLSDPGFRKSEIDEFVDRARAAGMLKDPQ